MTTAADRTETSEDFESTKALTAPPEKVLAALRTPEAHFDWWCPTTGSAELGGTLEMSFREHKSSIVLHVEAAEEGQVVWSVKETPLTPEWVGTTIVFEVEEPGDGATLHFRHHGLTPQLRVLRHVPRGLDERPGPPGLLRRVGPHCLRQGQLPLHHEHRRHARGRARRIVDAEAMTSWWGPATGSADAGGTLVVSFLGGASGSSWTSSRRSRAGWPGQ